MMPPMCGIRFFLNLVALALAVLPPSPAGAQERQNSLRVVEIRPLRFGMIARSGQSGIVRVTPDGRQLCMNIQCLGGAQSGLYAISGTPDVLIQITASATLLGNDSGAGLSFLPRLSNSTIVVSGNSARSQLELGGDLRVGAEPDAGTYLGDFEIIIEYQ